MSTQLDNNGGGIERELRRLSIGGAAMFVLLSAALVLVMGSLGEQVSTFDEEIVPTERAVGEMLGSLGHVADRETAILTTTSVDEVEAAGDDSEAVELAGGALATLRGTLDAGTVDELDEGFERFIASAESMTGAVRRSHEVDAALSSALSDSQKEVSELLALIDGLEGEIQLRYVLLLRALAADPTADTVGELVHGDVRVQGERVSAARTEIEVFGRRIEQVALTRNRDELNSLSSNELAQALASARSSVAHLEGALGSGQDSDLGERAAALAAQLEATAARVTDGDGKGGEGLVALRHAYFDALEGSRTAQAEGRARSAAAQESLREAGAQARALAAATQDKARSVRSTAQIGVTILVLLGLGLCGFSARRVLRALAALRQQNQDLSDLKDELAAANEGLEARVAERTAELSAREASTRLLLDSMGDALFKADPSGKVVGERSRATDEWFGEALGSDEPTVWDVLPATPAQRASIEFGWEQLADGFMPFEVAADQIPSRFERDGRVFDVEYRESTEGNVLVIVRDWTANEAAERAEREAREFQTLVGTLLEDREGFELTHTECEALMNELAECESDSDCLRVLHTLKGSTASVGFAAVAELAHELEDYVKEEASVPTEDQVTALRGTWDRSIGALKHYLASEESDSLRVQPEELERLQRFLSEAHPHDAILEFVDTWSLTAAKSYLSRLERQAKRIAAGLAKEVDVHVKDHGLRVPEALDPVWPALIHVVRNSLDHGIEAPSAREEAGKPRAGNLHISTVQRGEELRIEIYDDGAGIDADKLREQLHGQEPDCDVDAMTLVDLICYEGLSSKDEVTALSGRGVGVAAVAAAVRDLGGSLEVDSTPGKGTYMSFVFPETVEGSLSAAA